MSFSPLFAPVFVAVSLFAAAGAQAAPPGAAEQALAGVWATEVVLPVKWRMNLALEGGSGHTTVLALLRREPSVAENGSPAFAESTLVCGLEQPATKTMSLYGGERFAVRYLPQGLGGPLLGHSRLDAQGTSLAAEPLAVQAGLAMPAPLHTAWPRAASALAPFLLHHDAAGTPGAPAASRNDGGYVWPPVDYSASRRAHTFFIATRVPFRTTLDVIEADAASGSAQLVDVAGRPGIGASIVGCHTDDGGHCSPGDLSLTNSFQPAMRANGMGTVRMVRVSADATCEDVRAQFAP